MVRIKPFRAVRPPKEHASEVASRPYDVLNSAEAKAEATERSLLHIIKPEIDFDPIADEHSQPVYDKAVENFRRWQSEGWLRQDPEEYYYIYAQTMEGRTQYGLAMCCHFEDYLSGAIKKHELTRTEKEEDRMIHVRNQQANIEPVFFAYPDNAEIDALVEGVALLQQPIGEGGLAVIDMGDDGKVADMGLVEHIGTLLNLNKSLRQAARSRSHSVLQRSSVLWNTCATLWPRPG